ncbi:MAG: glycosyltransferase family 4 protein [Tepidisphaeraceae bacterium]
MRVVICWTQISGYMAACWRALAAREGIELLVVAFRTRGSGNVRFGDEVMAGVPCQLLGESDAANAAHVKSLVLGHRPDVVVIAGWMHPPYVALASEPQLAGARFVMGMDTPWRGSLRQRFARLKIGRYLDRMDKVVVAGERSWQFARMLKVPERKIARGVYGIDYATLAPIAAARAARPGGWPKRFLFTGRYEPVKGIDILVEAYARYRASIADPWPLTCCGAGARRELLLGQPGIEDRGFVQPADLPAVLVEHGAFVIASRFDPWPLVVVEACAAGLPVICTEACGSAVEVVRSHYNGLPVATESADALAQAFRWMHARHDLLPEMGRRSTALAAPYAAEVWADRWQALLAAPASAGTAQRAEDGNA